MAEIINLKDKFKRPAENLICSRPWEFRKADWETVHFIQMLRSESGRLEQHREENLPPHFSLKGGMAYTVRAIYVNRANEERMREVYYLTGLMDCMINQVNPVLRTDLLRAMYKKVFAMKEALNIHWYGPLDQVLLPIDSRFHSELEYRDLLKNACTMKELYGAIGMGTDKMFDILSLEYVFYCPNVGG